VVVRDTASGRVIGKPLQFPALVTSTTFDGTGRALLVAWSLETTAGLSMVDVQQGRELFAPLTSDPLHTSPRLGAGGQWIVALTSTGTRVWSARDGSLRAIASDDQALDSVLDPTGRFVAITSAQGLVHVRTLPDLLPVGRNIDHWLHAFDMRFSDDGSSLLTASWDGTARVHAIQVEGASGGAGAGSSASTRSESAVAPLRRGPAEAHGDAVMAFAVGPGETALLTGDVSGAVREWNLADRALRREWTLGSRVNAIATGASTGGGATPVRAAVAVEDGRVVLLEASGGATPLEPRFGAAVRDVAFAPDGSALVAVGDDGAARVWNWPARTRRCDYGGHRDSVQHIALAQGTMDVATSGFDGTVQIWSLRDCSMRQTPVRTATQTFMAAFGPDGRTLGAALAGGYGTLIDLRAGRPIIDRVADRNGMKVVRFSPDGLLVLFAGMSGLAEIFETRSGVRTGRRLEHDVSIWDAAFSPDSAFVLTGSFDRTARLWDARAGTLAAPLVRLPGQALGTGFSAGGGYAVITTVTGAVLVWRVAPTRDDVTALRRRVEVDTGLTIEDTGAIRPLSGPEWLARRTGLQWQVSR
jgi:WD40 repeat protein